jgi:protein-disulfide isomerase
VFRGDQLQGANLHREELNVAINTRQILIGVAALIVVAAGAFYFFVSREEAVIVQAETSAGETPTQSAQGGELMVPGPLGEMALGDPNAPNVVIEYASMTCPHCQRFHSEVFDAFKEKYIDTGKVYFLFREFPLDPLATAAIMIARCAPADRQFALVDLMFDNQRQWAYVQDPTTALRNLVRQAGFTQESFQACLTNQEILDGVNWVKTRASDEFDVNSTPTFFINGEQFTGEQSLEALDEALGG